MSVMSSVVQIVGRHLVSYVLFSIAEEPVASVCAEDAGDSYVFVQLWPTGGLGPSFGPPKLSATAPTPRDFLRHSPYDPLLRIKDRCL